MQDINKIFNLFSEEALLNSYECSFSANHNLSKITPLFLQKWDDNHPVFSYTYVDEAGLHEDVLSLHLLSPLALSPVDPPSFDNLYWLAINEEDSAKGILHYIKCGSVTPLSHLDIAIDDNFCIAVKCANVDTLYKRLLNDYVFDVGKYKLLFIQRFQNGSQDWNVYGYGVSKTKDEVVRRLTLQINEDHKRVARQERSGHMHFPNRFEDIEIVAYESVDFVNIGQASEAHEIFKNIQSSGDALLELWRGYSNMEQIMAAEDKAKLGKLSYEFVKSPKDCRCHVRFVGLTTDQSSLLKQLSSNNEQFEIVDSDSDSFSESSKKIVSIIRFNPRNNEAEFFDELYSMPQPTGALQLSLLGNEIVHKRRERAMKVITKQSTPILMNLSLAIEDMADKMFDASSQFKHIPAMSTKTKSFLKERFGIDSLTKNQEEAVEMALNNRQDITIIQGPPGTGKTTVVAAICHRLLELADAHKSKEGTTKTILASAFQNDTVEHLASKIYTHGLPTTKLGGKSKGVKVEEVYAHELQAHLDAEIEKRGGEICESKSKKLSDLITLYLAESNNDILVKIDDELSLIPLNDNFPIERYQGIKSSYKTELRRLNRRKSQIESLKLTVEEYEFEDGFNTLSKILASASEYNLSEDQIQLLENAPDLNPSEEFLSNLAECKRELLDTISDSENKCADKFKDDLISWFDEAVVSLRIMENESIDDEDMFIRTVLSEIKNDLVGNTPYLRRSLQEYGESVAATNQLAGSKEMKDFDHIQNVILEEAARSNPLDLLIPMIRAEERIIMVGDQMQLPHLLERQVAERSLDNIEDVAIKREKETLYEKSLFGILFDNLQKVPRRRCITLTEQFRMHPTIGDFISKVYYHGNLSAGSPSLITTKSHTLSLPWAKGKTFAFANVSSNFPESKTQSKTRREEAMRVMDILDEINSDPASREMSIGIITFYAGQVNVLMEEAEKHGYAKMSAEGYEISDDYKYISGEKEKLRIGSVDAFQGKEFDIVILSTVRSNNIQRIEGNEQKVFGFLTLDNRLNVAFSRAQKLVITVGDANMFVDDYAKTYVNGLYEFCKIAKEESYGARI